MDKERIKLLDNIVNCLDREDIKYLMRCAIPFRGLEIEETKDKKDTIEKLKKASGILFNPKSSEYHRICAFDDISKNHHKVPLEEVFNKPQEEK